MQRWCYKVGQLRISKIKSVLVIHQTIILLGFFFNLQALKKFENLNIIVSINILGKWTNKRIINLADIFFQDLGERRHHMHTYYYRSLAKTGEDRFINTTNCIFRVCVVFFCAQFEILISIKQIYRLTCLVSDSFNKVFKLIAEVKIRRSYTQKNAK